MLTIQIQDGQNVVFQSASGPERTFKTGSKGYFVSGKATHSDGRRYQISLSVVEIGSKPTATGTEPKPKKTLGLK